MTTVKKMNIDEDEDEDVYCTMVLGRVDSNVLMNTIGGNMTLKSYYIIILREHIKSRFNTHKIYVITFFVKHGCHTHFHEVLQTTLKS